MKRILLVEDNLLIALYMQKRLQKWGYSVTHLRDGSEVLSHISENSPHLVFLDLEIPEQNGYQILEALKTHSGQCPKVVVITAHHKERIKEKVFQLGADGYMTKPITEKELKEYLHSVESTCSGA